MPEAKKRLSTERIDDMLHNKTVAVVVPAYNEESQIGIVLDTMPDFVDRIIVINDCSTDSTAKIVKEFIQKTGAGNTSPVHSLPRHVEATFFNRADVILAEMREEEETLYQPHAIYNQNGTDRIVLIDNLINSKVGGAIRVGYKWCREHGIDCTAVMAGDAQMDPDELESICLPVVDEGIDYVKGNRLRHKAAKRMIPPKRFFGNSILSAMTKVASGYWRVSDTQTGYTAISLHALNSINLYDIYSSYGVPNDILIKLNIEHCTLREVPIKPVYAVGEQSKMKIGKVIPKVSGLLISGFFKRILKKYFLNDFHPIFLFYLLAVIAGLASIYFLVIILIGLSTSGGTVGTYSGFIALLVTTLLATGFGMWFDMDDNDRLQR